MKKILFTQRVNVIEDYNERRDCIDQKVPQFLYSCDLLPIPVPNNKKIAADILDAVSPRGIFLSGGNNLVKYGGDAPERDSTESMLLQWSIDNKRPIFGICRGCQFIADFFGTKLTPIEQHIKTHHSVRGKIIGRQVNSFHRFGITKLESPLIATAKANDNTVEAFRHAALPIAAIMWHPEREPVFSVDDIEMIREFYCLR